MTSLRFSIAVGGLAAVLTASVGTAAAVAAPAHTLHGVHVHTTSKHLVDGPHHTAPGITHFVNTGREPVFAFAAKKSGAAVLAADLKKADGKAGPVKLLADFTLLDFVAPGGSDYARLRRGTVYLVSADLAHPTAAKISSVSVSGPARNATLPPASRIAIDRSRGLHAARMLPHRGYLDLINRSNQLVELLIVSVDKDVTTATLRHFLNHPSFDDLAYISPNFSISFIGLMPPRAGLYQKQSSPKGRSVLVSIPLSKANLNELRLHSGSVKGVLFG